MKGQKNHLVSCDAITTSTYEESTASKLRKKQICNLIGQYKLDDEKEGRLGRLCNTAQWIIKVAQSRGAMSCLMIKNVDYLGRREGVWAMSVITADNQKLNLAFPGRWFNEVKEYFRPQQYNPFILSGAGAIIHPSSDKLSFSANACCLYMLDVSQFKSDNQHSAWHGWLDVSEAVIVEKPSLCEVAEERKADATDEEPQPEIFSTPPQSQHLSPSVNRPQQKSLPTPPAVDENSNIQSDNRKQKDQTISCKEETVSQKSQANPRKEEFLSPIFSTKRKSIDENDPSSHRSQKQRSIASSVEPDWLDTPAPVRIDRRPMDTLPLDTNTPTPSFKKSSSNISEKPATSNQSNTTANTFRGGKTMSKKAIAEAQEQRTVGGYLITPICKVTCMYKKQNTFGRVTSNEQIIRAGSGTGDYKLTAYLEDVFPLQGYKPLMTFNLFESKQSDLPSCKAGDMLAIVNFATREFNSAIQGTGYKGSTGWIVLSAETGKFQFSKSMEIARPMILCDEMRTHFDRMYKSIGTPAPVESRRRRQAKLSEVEPTVFFNAEVQVVSMWDGLQPCIYVTDYTCHPRLPMAQDVRLNVYTQDELKKQMERERNEGGGRVMPVYVWEHTDILQDIKAGDYLSMRNVRPKLNKADFLEGNIGDKDDSLHPNKINIYKIADEEIIKAIEERKEAYQEEAAISQAESSYQQSSASPSASQ
ncbi:uncharacterized protein FA14DRAFT_161426 [Meira miltonrushii]|uniref:Protection of telomeres protein 1 ssDNA-binding domain-containing protein n=1 Tax=Meira miltonrushii TaxID=1280837 RepID=A0A316V8Y5_9BASI|nr:uncharacterized protein FA14DRAFT_161426 [Meira miltonrushii]PWN33704.1 hypothetical protein FA14DRAFT_161426 [Meira miltonrushii]